MAIGERVKAPWKLKKVICPQFICCSYPYCCYNHPMRTAYPHVRYIRCMNMGVSRPDRGSWYAPMAIDYREAMRAREAGENIIELIEVEVDDE